MLTLFPVSCLQQRLIFKSALLITFSHQSATLTNYLWQELDKLESYTHFDFLTAFLAEWNMLPSSWASDWWRNVNNDVSAIKWSQLWHVPSNSSPFNQGVNTFAPLMCGAGWVFNEEFHLSSCSASNTTHSYIYYFLISPRPLKEETDLAFEWSVEAILSTFLKIMSTFQLSPDHAYWGLCLFSEPWRQEDDGPGRPARSLTTTQLRLFTGTLSHKDGNRDCQ